MVEGKRCDFVLGVRVFCCVVVLIHFLHAVSLDLVIEYKEVDFYSPNVTGELDGYRIAFVTDAHAISERGLMGIVDELNGRDIDLLYLWFKR